MTLTQVLYFFCLLNYLFFVFRHCSSKGSPSIFSCYFGLLDFILIRDHA